MVIWKSQSSEQFTSSTIEYSVSGACLKHCPEFRESRLTKRSNFAGFLIDNPKLA